MGMPRPLLENTMSMRAVSLMYHDVCDYALVGSGRSGIRGHRYTVHRAQFEAHMALLERHCHTGPALVSDLLREWTGQPSVALTFDDGGVSAYTTVIDVLDRYGWKAHFFIVTDWIGKLNCMNPTQIRELRARGHMIGSHSRSHLPMMSFQSRDVVLREWVDSLHCLSDILGETVDIASLPGGYYSRGVAEAASCSGIRALFTSEPTGYTHRVGNCTIFGRYVIGRATHRDRLLGLLQGNYLVRAKEHATWALKTSARNFGGKAYLLLRTRMLERSGT
jgi:peptidoglycan/xylan/chitin deacetylase (PgdA/CDA1 family)